MRTQFYMNNITTVPEIKTPFKLETKSTSFFIGSCFATNLYNKFDNLLLNSTISPFGNIYNPKSLGNSISRLIKSKKIKPEECFLSGEVYQHFDFHSSLGNPDLKLFVKNINNAIDEASKSLLSADLLVITFGTAFIYEYNGTIINNCHRLNKKNFNRRAMSVTEITDSLLQPLLDIKAINKQLNILFTLSPVRHLRDCPQENSYSKALLRVGIEELCSKIGGFYFPSYEIMMDELRDYRWYDSSLTHPSNSAINYITDRFIESSQSDDLSLYLNRVYKLNSMINHKIMNFDSQESKNYIIKVNNIIEQIKKDYPEVSKLQKIRSYPHF